ncbi:MAG TPA: BadF/BadG/BcrA/BcrD ATPase family protein [Stellaceae bacterium]|nr:BadF/BadG/BcrA/BcrD ATPase family protein [Stellaceae bacterium]
MMTDSDKDNSDLLLAIDGGGTRCRARLARRSGEIIGEGEAGPANLRLGLRDTFAAVLDAATQCLAAADLPTAVLSDTTACLALAGASEPAELAAARCYRLPFGQTIVITDAEAACIGAHDGKEGAIIVIGTGSIGWCIVGEQPIRIGGWGLPVSDEGSGAWLGMEAIRRVLWAHDGRIVWTSLLAEIFARFEHDPHAIVRWAATAKPADYGRLAPLVIEHARRGDIAGSELALLAAGHIDALAARLVGVGAQRIALTGGLAVAITPYLAAETTQYLVTPRGDALAGALRIAAGASATGTAE